MPAIETPVIVFLDRDTVDAGGDVDFAPLRALGALTLHPVTAPEDLPGRIADAHILITNKVVIDGAAMDAAPSLKMIQVAATGVNNVDLNAARERGIAVCNVSGYSTPGVAQHAFALLLNLATSIHRFASEPQQWPRSPIFTRLDYPITEIAGRTLGIAGLGEIGGSVARIGEAFGMRIVGLARQASQGGEYERVEREAFFAESDVISLHCPLTQSTREMINAETLSWMKPTAFLINTGRGGLIDELALASALRAGGIAGAALDVLSQEPPPPDHPLLEPSVPNLIITPHTAWASRESRTRLMDGVAGNIRGFLDGSPRNRIA